MLTQRFSGNYSASVIDKNYNILSIFDILLFVRALCFFFKFHSVISNMLFLV